MYITVYKSSQKFCSPNVRHLIELYAPMRLLYCLSIIERGSPLSMRTTIPVSFFFFSLFFLIFTVYFPWQIELEESTKDD